MVVLFKGNDKKTVHNALLMGLVDTQRYLCVFYSQVFQEKLN